MTNIMIMCTDCQKTYNGLVEEPTPHLCQVCRIKIYKEDRDIWQSKLWKTIRDQVSSGLKESASESSVKNEMLELRIKLIEQWVYDFEHGVNQSDVRRLYK